MKNKKIGYVIVGVCILIVVISIGVAIFHKSQPIETQEVPEEQQEGNIQEVENSMAELLKNDVEEQSEEEQNAISTLKNEIGSNADNNLYQVAEEYDGRKTIVIKPSIQFQVALAGALKRGIPEEGEIEQQLKTISQDAGIWITEPSRQQFKNMLEACGMKEFVIDEKGYLKKTEATTENVLSKKLEQMLQNGKTYVIDISGTCYMRDDVTGEITEYPFEQMDPYQICEPFLSGNNVLLVVTSNSHNQLSLSEMMQTILQY